MKLSSVTNSGFSNILPWQVDQQNFSTVELVATVARRTGDEICCLRSTALLVTSLFSCWAAANKIFIRSVVDLICVCRVGRRAGVDDRADVLIDVSVAVAESTIGSDPAGLGHENNVRFARSSLYSAPRSSSVRIVGAGTFFYRVGQKTATDS